MNKKLCAKYLAFDTFAMDALSAFGICPTKKKFVFSKLKK